MRTRVGSTIACPREVNPRIPLYISAFADISSPDVNGADMGHKSIVLGNLQPEGADAAEKAQVKNVSDKDSHEDNARKNEGKIRRRYDEEQLNQVSCLNLVTNAVVLWNIVYLSAVLDQLRSEGHNVDDADVLHLSREPKRLLLRFEGSLNTN